MRGLRAVHLPYVSVTVIWYYDKFVSYFGGETIVICLKFFISLTLSGSPCSSEGLDHGLNPEPPPHGSAVELNHNQVNEA
jgi:hypothetical protein